MGLRKYAVKHAYEMKNLLSVDREATGLVGHEALSLGRAHCRCVRDVSILG